VSFNCLSKTSFLPTNSRGMKTINETHRATLTKWLVEISSKGLSIAVTLRDSLDRFNLNYYLPVTSL
jgi:hypothetical protein